MNLDEVLELALEPALGPCAVVAARRSPRRSARVADLLERRATVSMLLAAHEGALRFNEFLQVIGRLPPATLASRLAELEQAGVLEREVLDTRPPGVEYRLTLRGARLGRLVAELRSSPPSELTPGRRLSSGAVGSHRRPRRRRFEPGLALPRRTPRRRRRERRRAVTDARLDRARVRRADGARAGSAAA